MRTDERKKLPRWAYIAIGVGVVILCIYFVYTVTGANSAAHNKSDLVGNVSEEVMAKTETIPEDIIENKIKEDKESGNYRNPTVTISDVEGALDGMIDKEFLLETLGDSGYLTAKEINATFSDEYGILYVAVELHKDAFKETLKTEIIDKKLDIENIKEIVSLNHYKIYSEYLLTSVIEQKNNEVNKVILDYTVDDGETIVYRADGDEVISNVTVDFD